MSGERPRDSTPAEIVTLAWAEVMEHGAAAQPASLSEALDGRPALLSLEEASRLLGIPESSIRRHAELCRKLGHDPAKVARIVIEPHVVVVEYEHPITGPDLDVVEVGDPDCERRAEEDAQAP